MENVNEFRFAVQRFSAVMYVHDAEAEETDRGAFSAELFVRACPRSVTLRYVTLLFSLCSPCLSAGRIVDRKSKEKSIRRDSWMNQLKAGKQRKEQTLKGGVRKR